MNNLFLKRLYNTNNNINKLNIKYNNINSISKKDNNTNFKRKLSKFKLTGSTNNMLNYIYIKDSNGTQTYIKTKNIHRANSANDCLFIDNKLNKGDKRNNNNINKKSKKQFNIYSNTKNKFIFSPPN